MLQQLWQTEPLGENIDRITEFVDVSAYYKLRVCGFSDTLTDIHIEWSHDGQYKCISSAIKIGSHLWRSEELKTLMPFVRLHIINNSGKVNTELRVTVHQFGGQSQAAPAAPAVPAEPAAPIAIEVEPATIAALDQSREVKFDIVETPAEPPKKRTWLSKKLSSPKHTCRDDRLPGFLPKDSILITDRRGSIIPLAPGNPGEILAMTQSGPQWISISHADTEFV